MKRITVLTIIILALCGSVFGLQPSAFVDIGGGARPSALGDAFVAVADDANSVFYNPAGMATSKYNDVAFMYGNVKSLVPYNYIAGIYNFEGQRAAGFGLIVSGDALEDEKTFILSYDEKLDWLLRVVKNMYIGVNLKLQAAGFGSDTTGGPDRMQGNAFGAGFDLGLLWHVNEQVQVGAMIKNAFSDVRWNTQFTDYEEGVPLTSDFGVSYRIPFFLISSDITDLDMLHIGVEKNIFTYIDLRVGYTQTLDVASTKQYMTGIGIGHFQFGRNKEFSTDFDVAYLFEQLDNTLKIQMSFKFK